MKLAQRLALGYIRGKLKILSRVSKKKAAQTAFDLFCTPQFRNRKKLPPVFKDAETLRDRFREYDIVGYRWNKGAGRRALIIHGFESSVVNFDRYVKPLISKGYEVLAFDAPAHGRSSGNRINALILRDFLFFIQEKYGPVQSWLAHSFGGLATCLALEMIPHNSDYRLVLVAPLTETTTAMASFFKMLKLEPSVQTGFIEIIRQFNGKDPEWYSIRRAIKNIKAQVLWFHDEEDAVTPFLDASKVRDDDHPNVSFSISKGLGHRRIYRDNKVKKRIVDFL